MKKIILIILAIMFASSINAKHFEGILIKDSFEIEYTFYSTSEGWALDLKVNGPDLSREVFYLIYESFNMWSFCELSQILTYEQKEHFEVFTETFPIIPNKLTKALLEVYLVEQIFGEVYK